MRGIIEDTFGLVGELLDGKFRLDRVVAEGGYGVVYAGHHLGLDVPIAIKVLKTPRDLSDAVRVRFVETFVLEAKTIAKLKHPAIVQVLDTGVTPSRLGPAAFMVLEWLDGETLANVLTRRRNAGGESPRAALELLRPVFDALSLAHESGVAHRDIKPQNIMLVRGRRGPTAKVLDFGIAKLMSNGEDVGSGFTQTSGNTSTFSPRYAAPEQVGATRTGPWTDVHALGLLFTELLIDAPAFRGATATELFQEVLLPERPTPAKYGRDAGALEGVLRKALAFKPDDRYRSASEMLAAIEQAIEQLGAAAATPCPGLSPDGRSEAAGQTANASTVGATTTSSIVRATATSGGRTRVRLLALFGVLAASTIVGATWKQFTSRSGGGSTDVVSPGPAQRPIAPRAASNAAADASIVDAAGAREPAVPSVAAVALAPDAGATSRAEVPATTDAGPAGRTVNAPAGHSTHRHSDHRTDYHLD